MDLFVYILLIAKFVLFIVFALVKIFWFVFVILLIKIVINILRKWYGNDSKCTNYNRDVDVIDLFPTDTVHGSVYSVSFDRPSVKHITDDNKPV